MLVAYTVLVADTVLVGIDAENVVAAVDVLTEEVVKGLKEVTPGTAVDFATEFCLYSGYNHCKLTVV